MEPSENNAVFKRPGGVSTARFMLHINGKVYPLHEGMNTVGRNSAAVVNIKSLNVSHYHAIITVVSDNELYLTDLKSANGTHLDNRKLEHLKLYKLKDNDKITFGNVSGVFHQNGVFRQRDEHSQSMSQDFYSAPTQPMFEDIHDLPTQAMNIHEMPTQPFLVSPPKKPNIHELPTQLFETGYPEDVHEVSTQAVECSELPPPQAFVDISSICETSVDYFMPSTSVTEAVASTSATEAVAPTSTTEAVASTSNTSGGTEVIRIIVEEDKKPATGETLVVLPSDGSEECSQFPVGRVKRKPNPLDSPERSPDSPLKSEESQIPARPMPKKLNVFDSGSSPEEKGEPLVKRKSIYALSSDSDTDLEDNDRTADSCDVIPCTQEYSCNMTESFNLQMEETQAQIVEDKENVSLNVQLDSSSDDIVDETVFLKSPEANMDFTCVSEKLQQGESSKRQEVSMDLTCTSVRSTQENKTSQNGEARVPEAIPEEDEGQTQLDYFEPAVKEDQEDNSAFLALLVGAEGKAEAAASAAAEAENEAEFAAPANAVQKGRAKDVACGSKESVQDAKDPEDDLYLQPTQCFDQSEPRNDEIEDLYLQPTQVLTPYSAVTNAENKYSDVENDAPERNRGGDADESSELGGGSMVDAGLDAEKEQPETKAVEQTEPGTSLRSASVEEDIGVKGLEENDPKVNSLSEMSLVESLDEKSLDERGLDEKSLDKRSLEGSLEEKDDEEKAADGYVSEEMEFGGKSEENNGEARSAEEVISKESSVELIEIPETQPTCVDSIEPTDAASVEAGIATLFMGDENSASKSQIHSSGESVEDQLEMLFHTQREKQFECTQQLVSALEDSFEGDKKSSRRSRKDDSGCIRFLSQESVDDSMLSTQTLVATLNKSDVCDDTLEESQLLTVKKDVKVKTYSKTVGGGTSSGESCSSDVTVIEQETNSKRKEEGHSSEDRGQSEEVCQSNRDEEQPDDGAKAKQAAWEKPIRLSTRGQLHASEEAEQKAVENCVEETNERRASSRRTVSKAVSELVETASKRRRPSERGSAAKQEQGSIMEGTVRSSRKGVGTAESGDDSAEETSDPRPGRQSAAVNEPGSGRTRSGRSEAVTEPKPGTSKQETPKPGRAGSAEKASSRASSRADSRAGSRASSRARSRSSSRTSAKPSEAVTVPKPSTSKQREGTPEPTTSRVGSRASSRASTRTSAKQLAAVTPSKPGTFKQREETPEPTTSKASSRASSRAGAKETEAVTKTKPATSRQREETPEPTTSRASSRASSRSSAKQAEAVIEPKPGTSKQREETPEPTTSRASSRASSRAKAKQPEAVAAPKPGTSRQREETPEPITSRASSRQLKAATESKSGTSGQLETPKLGRPKRKTQSKEHSPEKQTRNSRSKTSEAAGSAKDLQQDDESEEEENVEENEAKVKADKSAKVCDKTPDREESDEATNDRGQGGASAKPIARGKRKAVEDTTSKKRTKIYESGDDFEDDSPKPASPKKQIAAKTTRKKRGDVVAEKVKVTVPKTEEPERNEADAPDQPSTSKQARLELDRTAGQATKARRLSAHSRSVRNAQQAKQTEEQPSTSRKRSANTSEDLDGAAPPVKKIADTPERNKRKTKPKVIFTMMDDPGLESMVRQLGGLVVDSVQASTVLVTGNVKRSMKLLMAVGYGKPICSPDWIKASKKSSSFLDPWDYILVDKEAQKKWNFSLRESLSRSQNFRLFEDYTFQICVTTAVDVLKGAIEACGGKVVTKGLAKCTTKNLVVVGTKEVEKKYAKIIKDNPAVIVVEPEAIFDGTLRQELRFDKHLVK